MTVQTSLVTPGKVRTRRSRGRQAYILLVLLLGLGALAAGLGAWITLVPRQPFLVAAQRLPAGTMITPEDVTTVQANPAVVPAGTFQQESDAVGQTVSETLEVGDFVTPAHLSNAPGRVTTGLAPDQRLITIPTNGANALVDGLEPGDRFDLLLSFPTPAGGTGPSGALIEGLVLHSISSAGAFEVVVPLSVAIFVAQTVDGGKLSILASPEKEPALGIPPLPTGQVCQIFLAPDGSLVPEAALPAGVTPCPGIYQGASALATPNPAPTPSLRGH